MILLKVHLNLCVVNNMKHIVIWNSHWCSGGAESMITNLISAMDKSNLQFTILVTQKESNLFDDILKENQVNFKTILEKPISNPIWRTLKNGQKIKKALLELKIDVLHINCSNASGLKYAKLAKRLGIPKVIVHSHNAKIEKDIFGLKTWFHKHWKKKYSIYPDVTIACSELAYRFMFSKKCNKEKILLNNGVDTYKLQFNKIIRNELRNQYGISEDEILLGHIGRFVEQKNHKFLIDIVKELKQRNFNCRLMLLGEGYLKPEIFQYAEACGVASYIIDAGVQKDAYRFYQAFDYFLLPSLHEGLPVVGIEAQAAGLPCAFADTIDQDIKILDSSVLLPINQISYWVDYILHDKTERKDTSFIIKEHGYDIRNSAKTLKEIYTS